nr:hypothetical protein [Pseudoerythrocladia kornmannii]
MGKMNNNQFHIAPQKAHILDPIQKHATGGFIELSCSGSGLHIWNQINQEDNNKKTRFFDNQIELYTNCRFLIFTLEQVEIISNNKVVYSPVLMEQFSYSDANLSSWNIKELKAALDKKEPTALVKNRKKVVDKKTEDKEKVCNMLAM